MRYFLLSFLILLSSTALAKENANPSFTRQPPKVGLLERVIDGDTFVSMGKKIRLWGIDAPEKGEDYSLAATLYLEVLLEKSPFSCFYKHTDRYKRLVMQCFSGELDIGEAMVSRGLAKDFTRYSKGYYLETEKEAKELGLGIWSH